jgi:hypothetical protein
LNKRFRQGPKGGRRGKRGRGSPGGEQFIHPPVSLNEEGVPVAIPDAPKASPVVFVSTESLARYPWLPPRVIAGSVWRGPAHERLRVDENGVAAPYRAGQFSPAQ